MKKALTLQWRISLSFLVLLIFCGLNSFGFAQHSGKASTFQFNSTSGRIEIFSSGKPARALPLSYKPSGVAANPAESLLYVLNQKANSLEVYDLSALRLIRSIAVEANPVAMAVNQNNGNIYILGQKDSRLSVIDPNTYSTISQRNTDSEPSAMAVDHENHRIFVSSTRSNSVQSMDESSLSVLDTFRDFDFPPRELAVGVIGSKLYVRDQKNVTVLNSISLQEIGMLRLEGYPKALFLSRDGSKLYVPLSDIDSIAVFDTEHDNLIDWYELGNTRINGKRINSRRWYLDEQDIHFFTTDGTTVSSTEVKEASQTAVSLSVPAHLVASPELLLNSDHKNGTQDFPSVDYDSSGNFVAAWSDLDGFDGNSEGIAVREFNASGTPQKATFVANTKTSGVQGNPAVGSLGNGDFVIGWRDDGAGDNTKDPYFRRFSNGGTAKDPQGQIAPSEAAGNQYEPWLDSAPNGDFVAVWSGKVGNGTTRDIVGRRFNANGTPKGPDFTVNSTTAGQQYAPVVAVGQDGRFVVIWRHSTETSDTARIRLFDAAGNPVGDDFVAGPGTRHFAPFIAIDSSGKFVAVWQENNAGGVRFRRFDSNKVPLSAGSQLGNDIEENIFGPGVAMASNGTFAICWRNGGLKMFARHFQANGTPIDGQFQTATTGGDQVAHHVAMDQVGNFIVSWKHRDHPMDGSAGGIIARIFSVIGASSPLTVTDATPNSGNRGDNSHNVTITGTGFDDSVNVDFNDPEITVNGSPTNITETSFVVNIAMGADAILGFHDITVTTDSSSATGNDLFEVKQGGQYPAPNVNNVSPSSALQGQTLDVDINGSDFANHPNLSATFGSGIVVNSIIFIDDGQAKANITINSQANTGGRNVVVTNPGGAFDTCNGCFQVLFNPTLYTRDFSDGVNDWPPDKGVWSATTLNLFGTHTGKATAVSPFAGCLVCSFSADIRIGSGSSGSISLLVWFVDNDNYVELVLNRNKDKWQLKQRSGGKTVLKESDPQDLNGNQFYNVTVAFDGTDLTVSIDRGPAIFTVTPAVTLQIGTIAFRVKNATGTIDNVVVLP